MLSLIVLKGPGKGRVFRLAGDHPTIIGRQAGDLRLMDREVSRKHAEINLENGTWVLRDLGSSNGTRVNGELVEGLAELEEGDQLQFGHFMLVVGQLDDPSVELDETQVVDAEEMDHIVLSPEIHAAPPEPPTPTPPSEREEEADVLSVQPIEHTYRPDEPTAESQAMLESSQEEPLKEESHVSIFDQEEPVQTPPSDEPVEAEDLLEAGPSPSSLAEEQPLAIEQLLSDLEEDDLDVEEVSPEPEAAEEAPLAEVAVDILASLDDDEIDEVSEIDQKEEIEQETDVDEMPADLIASTEVNPFAVFDDEALALVLSGQEEDSRVEPPRDEVEEIEVTTAAEPESEPEAIAESMARALSEEIADEDEISPAPETLDETVCEEEPREEAADLFGAEVLSEHDLSESKANDDPNLPENLKPPNPPEAPPPEAPPPEAPEAEISESLESSESPESSVPAEPPAPPEPFVSPRSDEADDVLHPPRPMRDPSKSRLIWPIAIALLLLMTAGGGVGGWLVKGLSSSHKPDAVGAAEVSGVSGASGGGGIVGVSELDKVWEPVDDLPMKSVAESSHFAMVSPLEDGPRLLGGGVLTDRVGQVSTAPLAGVVEEKVSVPVEAVVSADRVEEIEEVSVSLAEVSAVSDGVEASAEPVVEMLDASRVVYLVDASGSLVDTLPLVLHWLDRHLRELDSTLTYTVIFFRADEVIEVPPMGMKDASDRSLKRKVRRWLDWEQGNVFPAGRSDPREAMDLALSYRAGQVFILSDGHVADRLTDEQLADYLIALDDRVGDATFQVHSVQFFYPKVEGLLAHLVRRYPGEQVFVDADRDEDARVVVPLEELTALP